MWAHHYLWIFFILCIGARCCNAFTTRNESPSRTCHLIETSNRFDKDRAFVNDFHDADAPSRRQFLKRFARDFAVVLPLSTLAANKAQAATATTAVDPNASADLFDTIGISKPANPFVKLETVGMIPKAYFEENRSIYGFVERILDGDTVRVSHVPGYSFTQNVPEPLQKRGIAEDTLLIRLYGIDCPEVAKNKKQTTQPFGDEAKQFTSDLIYHHMVKVTFLSRDRYGRAIAMVETLPSAGFLLSGLPGLGPKDLSVELARQGLAELYEGGGAEYYTKKDELLSAIREARAANRGIWSLGESRVSAAEQKRILRGEGEDPAAVFSK